MRNGEDRHTTSGNGGDDMSRDQIQDSGLNLVDYLYGEMPAEETAEFEASMDEDQKLAGQVQDFQNVLAAYRSLPTDEPSSATVESILSKAHEAPEPKRVSEHQRDETTDNGSGHKPGWWSRLVVFIAPPERRFALGTTFSVLLVCGIALGAYYWKGRVIPGSPNEPRPTPRAQTVASENNFETQTDKKQVAQSETLTLQKAHEKNGLQTGAVGGDNPQDALEDETARRTIRSVDRGLIGKNQFAVDKRGRGREVQLTTRANRSGQGHRALKMRHLYYDGLHARPSQPGSGRSAGRGGRGRVDESAGRDVRPRGAAAVVSRPRHRRAPTSVDPLASLLSRSAEPSKKPAPVRRRSTGNVRANSAPAPAAAPKGAPTTRQTAGGATATPANTATYSKALRLARSGRHKQAVVLFRTIAWSTQYRSRTDMWLAWARSELALGHLTRAERILTHALRIAPKRRTEINRLRAQINRSRKRRATKRAERRARSRRAHKRPTRPARPR